MHFWFRISSIYGRFIGMYISHKLRKICTSWVLALRVEQHKLKHKCRFTYTLWMHWIYTFIVYILCKCSEFIHSVHCECTEKYWFTSSCILSSLMVMPGGIPKSFIVIILEFMIQIKKLNVKTSQGSKTTWIY